MSGPLPNDAVAPQAADDRLDGQFSLVSAVGEALMLRMGRHRKQRTGRPAHRAPRRSGLCAWVDLTTLIEHLLTLDAAAAGRLGGGRYIALCGTEVIPASMVEPGRGSCQPCRVALIPAQRSRGSRR